MSGRKEMAQTQVYGCLDELANEVWNAVDDQVSEALLSRPDIGRVRENHANFVRYQLHESLFREKII